MKDLRINKLLTTTYPLIAIIIGLVCGYGTVFFGPYLEGIITLLKQNFNIDYIARYIQYVGLASMGITLCVILFKEYVKNTSMLFSLFGLSYLGSLAYFTRSILEIIS